MSSRKKKKQRARAESRRKARRAAKRATPKPRGQVQLMPRSDAEDGLYDDCPICRALRKTGVAPDRSGVVTMTQEQQVEYQRHLEQIVAEEGWPEGHVSLSGEEMIQSFSRAAQILEQQGHPTNIETMNDEELADFLHRIGDVVRSLERDDALRRSDELGSMLN